MVSSCVTMLQQLGARSLRDTDLLQLQGWQRAHADLSVSRRSLAF